MECVGAVKALGHKTQDLDNKIIKLEQSLVKPLDNGIFTISDACASERSARKK